MDDDLDALNAWADDALDWFDRRTAERDAESRRQAAERQDTARLEAERMAHRVGMPVDELRPEREPWRQARELVEFDALVVPAGVVDYDGVRWAQPEPWAVDLYPAAYGPPPVLWAHAGFEPRRTSYGELIGWYSTVDGFNVRGVTCTPGVCTDWAVSLGSIAGTSRDDGLRHVALLLQEVSLLAPPFEPGLPGARVTRVRPFDGTADDVRWLSELKPASESEVRSAHA